MKRVIYAAFVSVISGHSVAQSDAELEHVLVSVPIHKSSTETAFPIETLVAEELSRAASATLGGTLSELAGIHNASFGPGVGQPVIRGLQGPRVMVLQNGTRSADVASLSADHAITVEPLLADAVELLRGPATLHFGGGALGGVINVIDGRIPREPIEAPEGKVEYRFDGAQRAHVGVGRIDWGAEQWSFHVDGVRRLNDEQSVPSGAGTGMGGSLSNTDGWSESQTFGTSRHFEGGYWGIAYGTQHSRYGLPLAEPGDEGIAIAMRERRVDTQLHWHDPLPGVDTLRAFFTDTEYQHQELEDQEVGTVYRNDTREFRLELVHPSLAGWHGALGVQWSDSEFSALGDEAFVPNTDIRRVGVFVAEDVHVGPVAVELGLRRDLDILKSSSQRAREYQATSATMGLVWELDPAWHIDIAVARAERAPAPEELFSNVGNNMDQWVIHAAANAIELGAGDLDTELSTNAELGLTYHKGGRRAAVTLYQHDFDRYVALSSTGQVSQGVPVFAYLQLPALFEGAELKYEQSVSQWRDGEIFAEVRADWVRGRLDGIGPVIRMPPRRAQFTLSWESDSQRVFSHWLFSDRHTQVAVDEAETAGYVRWDLGAEWRLLHSAGTLTLSCGVDNVLDQTVRLSTSPLSDYAPEPGRAWHFSVRFEH